jgi:hypothetical protein
LFLTSLKNKKTKAEKMLSSVTISVPNLASDELCEEYVVSYDGKEVQCNGQKLEIDFENHENENERKDCLEFYQNLIADGVDEKIARVKAGLFMSFTNINGDEEETMDPVLMEFRDQAVLHLLGLISNLSAMTGHIKINITEDLLDSLSSGSSMASCDFALEYYNLVITCSK